MPVIMKNGHTFGEGNGTTSEAITSSSRAEKAICDGSNNIIDETYERLDMFNSRDMNLLEAKNNAPFHNSIFMGRDITDKFNDGTFYQKIADGSFEDLFIGDYFVKAYDGANKTFRIAGFNSYYNQGDNSVLTAPHVVIVPDEYLANAKMNSTDVTTGGVVGAAINTTIADIDTKLEAIFGSHLAEKRELLSTSVDNNAVSAGYTAWTGTSNGWAWQTVKSYLLSEVEVYGSVVWGSSGHDVASGYSQLPLFALAPEFVNPSRFSWWLRSVVSSTHFAFVSYDGFSSCRYASSSYGVRPRFVIR